MNPRNNTVRGAELLTGVERCELELADVGGQSQQLVGSLSVPPASAPLGWSQADRLLRDVPVSEMTTCREVASKSHPLTPTFHAATTSRPCN